ncbi:MAG TPA: lysyl oxidase family protein [Thermoleophilaceae bacterium]
MSGRTRVTSVLAAAAAAVALGVAVVPQRAGAGAGELLPDLVQGVPAQVNVAALSDSGGKHWYLGFRSSVWNAGDGPLLIHGRDRYLNGTTPYMVAEQIVHRDSGPDTTYEGIGQLHYYYGGNHNHWHFEPFDRYELVRPSDGVSMAPDLKQGFCLGDRHQVAGSNPQVFDQTCRPGEPDAASVDEGMSVGWADDYLPQVEGQKIEITGIDPGVYWLVHRVNGTRAIHETNYDNNAASVAVRISWPSGFGGSPTLAVLRSCPGADSCPLPPADASQPTPQPVTTTAGNSDRTAPKLVLSGARVQRLSRTRTVYTYVHCDEDCTLSAVAEVRPLRAARPWRFRPSDVALPAGARVKLTVRLPAKAIAAARRHRGGRVSLQLIATDLAGNASQARRTLALRVPRRTA